MKRMKGVEDLNICIIGAQGIVGVGAIIPTSIASFQAVGPQLRAPDGSLAARLLPAGARALAAVPPTVRAGTGECLQRQHAAVLRQTRQPCRTAGLRASPSRTPAPRLGGLRQGTMRRTKTGAGLSGPLYP